MGRHLREIPLHQLHNKDAGAVGEWEMEVSIQFDADGHQYDLRRRSVKKRLVAVPDRPEDFDVECYLQKDGMAISGDLVEAEINRFVPEQVSRFFLFDGELLQEYETLLIEGNEQGKLIKEAIEQVLGVPALINGRVHAGKLLKGAQKQQTKDLAQVKSVEQYLENQSTYRAKEDAYESDIEKLTEKLKKTKDERASLSDEIEKSDAIYKAKIKLDEKTERRNQITSEINEIDSSKLVLVSKAWRDLLKPKLTLRRDALLDEQLELMNQIGKKSSLEKEVEQIQSLLSKSECPTCSQEFNVTLREKAGAKLGGLQGELRAFSDNHEKLTTISAEIDTLNKLVTQGVGEMIREKDRQKNILEVEQTRIENEMEVLREEIQGQDTTEMARKRALKDALIREEGKLGHEIEMVSKELKKVQIELAIIARQIDSIPEARAKRSTAYVNLCTGLERAFGESVEKLRESLRNSVESRASEAFKQLITQQAYKGLRINTNYGLTILDERETPVSIRSAGAEQIVALSLIDGLSRTGRANGPVVMDTPFGRLDLKHRDNILKYLPISASQLILLVHDGEIRAETDLAPIASRIGGVYHIKEKGPRHSVVERNA
jgi:DNA sulfur modification protein DndD